MAGWLFGGLARFYCLSTFLRMLSDGVGIIASATLLATTTTSTTSTSTTTTTFTTTTCTFVITIIITTHGAWRFASVGQAFSWDAWDAWYL